jgi:glycosyltransferase involved in cell wall biosynthesis
MKPIKIIHIVTVPLTLVFLRGFLRSLLAKGYEVEVVSSPGPLLDEFGEQEGIPTWAVEMPRKIDPLADLRALRQLVSILKERKPDLIDSQTPKGGLLGTMAGFLSGVPVRIYHMRGLPLETARGVRKQILRTTEWISCHLSHRTLAVSKSMAELAIRELLVSRSRIKVLAGGSGQGVDTEQRFNPDKQGSTTRQDVRNEMNIPPDAIVIGFIGRIVRDKGVIELIDAWKKLDSQGKHLHLVIVGPWEEQDPVPAATRQTIENDPCIHVVGFSSDTPKYYTMMDLVVLPTYREGFPIVPLEAAAMALPVVASSIPGCQEAVEDGKTGLLVPVKDSEALRNAIQYYLDEPSIRIAHGAAGRVRAIAQFRQEVFWEAIEKEYRSLLDSAKR